MATDTTTANYGWVLPAIGGDPTSWGNKWNADLQLIDGQVHSNQVAITAGVCPIGSITMFGSLTPPTGWLLCDGTVYNNTSIPLLAPILNNKFGGVAGTSNAVPNLVNFFPLGAASWSALGQTGGEANHTLGMNEIPGHQHY